MRGGWRLGVLLLCTLGASAGLVAGTGDAAARVVARPKPPLKPAPDKKPAPPAKVSTSYWEPLVLPGARFHLTPKDPPAGTTARIAVEAYDVRTLKGGVKVARLRWTVLDGQTRSPMGNSLPTQLAVVPGKGAWLLTDRLDDAAVLKAVKQKPSFADPPKVFTGDDAYVRKDGDTFCVGVGTPPAKEPGWGVTHAEYCLAKGEGLVAIAGNHTPGALRFEAPRRNPAVVGTPGALGIPACDEMIAVMNRCLPHFPADQRQAMEDAIRQMTEAYRQASSASPEAREQINQACLQADRPIRDSLRSMGCPI